MTSISQERILTAQRLENWDNTADVKELLTVIPEGRILEIGCGTGRIIEELSKPLHHSSFVGLDIDDFYLNIARQKHLRNAVFIHSSAIESIFPNQSFDVVLFRDSLHEIREQLGEKGVCQTLHNAFCYMKYGGMLIIRDAIRCPEQIIKVTFTSESTKSIFQIFTQLWNIQLPQFEKDILLRVKDAVSFFGNYKKILMNPQISDLPEITHYSLAEYNQLLTGQGFIQSEIRLYRFLKHRIPKGISIDVSQLPETYCMLIYSKNKSV